MQERRIPSLGQKDALEKEMQPTPVVLPGKFHEQKILADYNQWNKEKFEKKSDRIVQLMCEWIFYPETVEVQVR